MEKRYRSAVVGLGRIGMLMESDPKRLKPATHVGMHRAHPRVDLVGLVDADPEKRRIAETTYPQIPVYAAVEDLFMCEKMDILSISTANEAHVPVVLAAAEARVPAIICEKPIAETIEGGRQMVRACGEAGSLLFVNHFGVLARCS